MAEFDYSQLVAAIPPEVRDYTVIAETFGWVSNIELEDGCEEVKVDVKLNRYGNQLGVGPHNWFYIEHGHTRGHIWGRLYDCREDAMRESLQYLNWLIPHALNGHEDDIHTILRWAKNWRRIRHLLGYNWSDLDELRSL